MLDTERTTEGQMEPTRDMKPSWGIALLTTASVTHSTSARKEQRQRTTFEEDNYRSLGWLPC